MTFEKIFRKLLASVALPTLTACTSVSFPTVKHVDLQRYMGTWYVSAGRFTMFEKDVNNAIEIYSYDEKSQTIAIDFTYRQGTPDGKEKRIPQKGKVVAGSENAHWLISPFWPLQFDYLILALAEDYSWVAVGVPNQKYLWIMHRKQNATQAEINLVIERLKGLGYNIADIETVPQRW